MARRGSGKNPALDFGGRMAEASSLGVILGGRTTPAVRLRQEVMAEPLALVDRLDYAPRQLNIILRLLWPYVHRLEQVASSLQLRRCC